MILNQEEIEIILELIGSEQIHMIAKNHKKYDSNRYIKLEELKRKLKLMSYKVS
jgi:hypothetical protein